MSKSMPEFTKDQILDIKKYLAKGYSNEQIGLALNLDVSHLQEVVNSIRREQIKELDKPLQSIAGSFDVYEQILAEINQIVATEYAKHETQRNQQFLLDCLKFKSDIMSRKISLAFALSKQGFGKKTKDEEFQSFTDELS